MDTRSHVLVVGGTKGLGRVLTKRFLSRGAQVTVFARSRPKGFGVSDSLDFGEVDLLNSEGLQPAVDHAISQRGPVQYVVFAQRYRGNGDTWAGELQVSLAATNRMIEALKDCFVTVGDRGIAVVSSVYAHFVGASQPASYHVAKAGLNQLVRYYASFLGGRRIRINSIMPLTYLKDESREYYESNKNLMDVYSRFVPLGRLGDAEDSANLIDFLCSERASFITGQGIFVDGGVSVVWPEALAREFSGL